MIFQHEILYQLAEGKPPPAVAAASTPPAPAEEITPSVDMPISTGEGAPSGLAAAAPPQEAPNLTAAAASRPADPPVETNTTEPAVVAPLPALAASPPPIDSAQIAASPRVVVIAPETQSPTPLPVEVVFPPPSPSISPPGESILLRKKAFKCQLQIKQVKIS